MNDSHYRSVPLQVSRDGHRVAYFSRKHLKFMAWDLPTGQTKAISPRLDPQSLDHHSGLEISPDGGFFALTFTGARPRLLITEFATGKTTTLNGYCTISGMSRNASRIAVSRECSEDDDTYAEEWKGSEYASVLSPDGRTTVEIHTTYAEDADEYVITRDAMTGRPIKKFKLRLLSEPNDATGDGRLNDEEYRRPGRAPGARRRIVRPLPAQRQNRSLTPDSRLRSEPRRQHLHRRRLHPRLISG
ncbi:hypothetical protein [Spongiactinospora sp. 9N601]|uniref:hypothetical protein n=1 Tax=Spongiactinospora sp. 9N601 TaxID=3375149 RepID=UPI0037B228D5